jgi:hypothetical protein
MAYLPFLCGCSVPGPGINWKTTIAAMKLE